MFLPKCTSVVLFLLSSAHFIYCQYEGDPCVLSKNGNKGVCKFLSECDDAKASLRKGIYPQICGFEGSQSIVCCEENAAPPIPSRVAGEMSRKKCKQYADYVWETSGPAVLIEDAEETRTYDCPFDKLELIVGGTLATRKEFPHMAQIGYEAPSGIKWLCGGSLISDQFILTAAHCLNTNWGDAKHVRVGITNQSDLAGVQQRRVAQIIKHPNFARPSHYHDIGLLRLESNFKLNSFARPACLYTDGDAPRSKVVAAGFGKIQFLGKGSNDLLRVVLEIFNQTMCNFTYKAIYGSEKLMTGIDDGSMICAGSSTDVVDTCQGDSGGPLQIYHKNEPGIKCMYDIIGITSFGRACGLAKNTPGVYTKVANYIKWIEDNVWPDS